ncbi:MAG: penicillin-binding transpeptidase domain-containing protein [Lagierella massiliensis]|nr:penicillin-binding transpeptidase domain-containing protein [Lagierella massiliensis]
MRKFFKKLFKGSESKDRLFLTKVILSILMILLFSKLFYLTIIKGDYYRDISDNARIRDIEIVAPRGNIYDRNGEILASNKTVFTASILKNDFLELTQDERNENLRDLSRLLELDGSNINSDYSLSVNLIKYKHKDSYLEEENPIEKMIRIVKDNKLLPVIIYKEVNEDGYSYKVINTVIKSLNNKGEDLPIMAGSDRVEFEENAENSTYLRENSYIENESPYSFLGRVLQDDEGIIRNILNHPMGRKLVYEVLEERDLQENLEMVSIGFQDELILWETKAKLSKQYTDITEDSNPKDDFVTIVRESSIHDLISNVTINSNSEQQVVVPAKFALEILEKNNIKHNLEVVVDEEDVNNPIANIQYTDDGKYDLNAEDMLIALLEDNGLLGEFITSENIKYIAQSINTNKNIIPSISVNDWEYSYEKNISDMYEKYNLNRKENSVKDLYKKIVEYYNLQNFSKYDQFNIIKIYDLINKHGDLRYVPLDLTYNLSEVTFSAIEERFPLGSGIIVDSEPIRYYPGGSLASHIIGYIGKISTEIEKEDYLSDENYNLASLIGKNGIEESQERQLRGTNGSRRVLVDNRGNITEVLGETKPIPGNDVYTSLDKKIQKTAEKALSETINSLQTDNVFNSKWGDVNLAKSNSTGQYKDAGSGSVVVLNAKTGQLVALANAPDINLNMFSTGISASDWKNLFPKDERDLLAPRPLLNMALQSAIQPGSTFKLATSLAGLETGLDPDFTIKCQGYIEVGGRIFQDAIWGLYRGVHGNEGTREAIRDSCNYYFYNLALGVDNGSKEGGSYKLNVDDVARYAKILGLGEKTNIDINIPRETSGTLPDRQIKKRTYRSLYQNFLEENAQKYLIDKNTTNEELESKIQSMVKWIDEQEVPSETEIVRRLKELGFDTSKVIDSSKQNFSSQIKYNYIDQSNWLVGDSLNVVIGQGQNAYSPLQMARYMGTIANGGIKNKVSVVDEVKDPNTAKVIYKNSPTGEKIKIDDFYSLEVIREGAKMAAEEGGTGRILGKLPFEMGVKSGTAEVGFINPVTKQPYSDYGWMIGFAPYDDPEYVIAAVVTQAGTSANITPMIREIMGECLKDSTKVQ